MAVWFTGRFFRRRRRRKLNCARRFSFATRFEILRRFQSYSVAEMARWRNGYRALGLRSTGRRFKSYSGQKLHNNLGHVVHTYVPLSPSSILGTGQAAVMLCGWEGNRRPGGK